MFRRRYKRTYRRRTFKKRRYTSRRTRSNRIFKRFIRRDALKPELKYKNSIYDSGSIGNQNGATSRFYTDSVMPATITNGPTVNDRIGNQINVIKCDLRFYIRDFSNQTTPLSAPINLTYSIRCIIWSPRRPVAQALAHIQSREMESQIDYNLVTVYRDVMLKMSPTYIAEATTNEPNGGPRDGQILKVFKIKFPRKIKFTPVNDDLDPDKDMLFATFKVNTTSGAGIRVNGDNRVWFFDS